VVETAKSSIQNGPADATELEAPKPALPTDAPVFCTAVDVWVSEGLVPSSVVKILNSSCPTVAEEMTKPSTRNHWFSGNVAADVRIVLDVDCCMMILPAVFISRMPQIDDPPVVFHIVITRVFAAGAAVANR
jgi:hypothetical protein